MSGLNVISESVFDGKRYVVPMAEVAYIEKNGLSDEICVVMKGSQHPIDPHGNFVNGYGRADCPYLGGEEAAAFLSAWCAYRHEVDGPFNETTTPTT